jgi:hypothetical protein
MRTRTVAKEGRTPWRAMRPGVALLALAALLPSCGKDSGDKGNFYQRLYPRTAIEITETGGSTLVVEGGITDTYSVNLTSQPMADVTVTLTPDAQVGVSLTTVTFTSADWNIPRVITVTAVDDAVVEPIPHPGVIAHVAASTDLDYDGVTATLVVSVIDNDHAPGLTIVESGGSTNVVEGGATDTYTVALASPPTSDVTVTLTPDAQVTVVPTTLTFTSANWYIPQTVRVAAVDDAVREYNHTGTVTHVCASADAAYNVAGPTVTVYITDNDGCPISGTIRYTNSFFSYSPPTLTKTDQPLPVRQAEYEIVLSPGTVIASGVTDDSGGYAADLNISGSVVLFLRVYARRRDATSGISSAIETMVLNNDPAPAVYTAASTPAGVSATAPLTLNMTIPAASSGPFNIFDVSVLNQQFLFTLSGNLTPPLLGIYWSAGSDDGTYYDRATDTIHVRGTTDDPDEFDDDIILHEMGHYVLDNSSRSDSPGGSHSLDGHYDIRLTWSEGWASFWSSVVRQWANTNVAPAGRYPDFVWLIDSFATDVGAFRIDLPSYPATSYGADNEVSISSVLWDIAALPADGGVLGLGMAGIWNVITTRMPPRAQLSFEDFFDEWNAAGYAPLATILDSRTILYKTDGYEPNDSSSAATLVGALPATFARLTFFKSGPNPVGDENWFRLTLTAGVSYTIQTTNLGDGADTYLRLYSNPAGTPVAENDDNVDSESLIQYTPTTGGTYYIKVAPYAGEGATPQIATYGNYDLQITSP